MGEIRIDQDDEPNLTLFKVIGSVSCDDIVNAIQKAFENRPTKFAIWDFTEGSLSNVSLEDRGNIEDAGTRMASKRVEPVAVFVCADEMTAIYLKMYISYLDLHKSPIRTELVGTMNEAMSIVEAYIER